MYQMFAVAGLVITVAIAGFSLWRNRVGSADNNRLFVNIGSFIGKYYYIFLALMFIAFLASRMLRLESFPNGLHVDEIAVAVDAKSIWLNGTDRNGFRYPVYFYDYGNGQNALYVYIEALLLRFAPATIFTLRLPAVLGGVACFFAMFGICCEIMENKGYALMGPLLVTVLPMYIMSERWALEAYLFLPVSAVSMYFIIRAVKHGKWYDSVLSGLFIGLSLYTYAVSYMVWPIFIVLSGLYLMYIKKINFRQVLLMAVPLAILAFPLILYQLVNFHIIEPMYFMGSDYIPLANQRGEEMSLRFIPDNLRYFKKLFLGGDELTYNSFSEFGTIYMFLLPFVLAGFIICIRDTIKSVRSKSFSASPLLLFFWFGGTVFMLIVEYANINRVNELFLPFLLFIVIAVHRLFARDGITLSWLTLWTGASFVFFMYFYFFVQNSVYGYHLLHTSASAAKAVVRSEETYLRDTDTKIYIQMEDEAIASCEQLFYFAGRPGDVFEAGKRDYGRVIGSFPEEFDINENAVYILSNNWPHIISYLISEGFAADQTLPGYSILYRL